MDTSLNKPRWTTCSSTEPHLDDQEQDAEVDNPTNSKLSIEQPLEPAAAFGGYPLSTNFGGPTYSYSGFAVHATAAFGTACTGATRHHGERCANVIDTDEVLRRPNSRSTLILRRCSECIKREHQGDCTHGRRISLRLLYPEPTPPDWKAELARLRRETAQLGTGA